MKHKDTKSQRHRERPALKNALLPVFLRVFVPLCLCVSFPAAFGQSLQDVLKRGEEVFDQSCTGYCHATKGGGGGAPRLAVRGFDQAYISNIVTRIPVAGPISKVPDNVQTLRTLVTPLVSTAVMNGESMPALVLSTGTRSLIFYDLTTPPPVLVTAEPSAVKLSDGSSWRHASVIGSTRILNSNRSWIS